MNIAPSANGRITDAHCGNRLILPHHRNELRASGLTEETIVSAGIYSVTDRDELAHIINWNSVPRTRVPAMVFPFIGLDGQLGYARAKPDVPQHKDGNPVKYESPQGRPNEIYLPPNTIAVLSDPTVALLITEGEKKSLSADQAGFACLGLVGVWGWKVARAEELIASMARVTWQGRNVFIAFDSDRETNPQVRDAEARLALQLQRRGANVKIVRLPPGPPGEDGVATKVGLDDFLVAEEADALRAMIAGAGDPEPPASDQLRTPAGNVDPRDEICRYVDTQKIDGLSRIVFWQGSWWRWKDGCYVLTSEHDVQAELVTYCQPAYADAPQGGHF